VCSRWKAHSERDLLGSFLYSVMYQRCAERGAPASIGLTDLVRGVHQEVDVFISLRRNVFVIFQWHQVFFTQPQVLVRKDREREETYGD
jgi:hypothetical protein